MKKRYSIIVREYGSDHDVELMQVDSNPQAVVDGLYRKTLKIGKRKLGKYLFVRIVDNEKA